MQEKLNAEDGKEMDRLIYFMESCGMPGEIVKKMNVSQLKAVVEFVSDIKKN
jgi:hypothetical protein